MNFYIKRLFKTLALALAFCLFITTLTACNKDKAAEEDPAETSEEYTGETDEDGNPIEPPPPVKVGFLYYGALEHGTLNRLMDNARLQLEKNLGVETCYIEGVLAGDFYHAVEVLAEREVNVIVSASNALAGFCELAAGIEDYKDIKFISYGGESSKGNLAVFKPLLYQPAHVCGLTAAVSGDNSIIGIVADSGMYNVYGVIDSFILGAKLLPQSNFSVVMNFADSDYKEDTYAAIDDAVSKGADVIFLYQATDYGIKYCEEIGVKVIGFADNMPELAPEWYVSGFFLNANSFITEQVRYIENNEFRGMPITGGLDTGYVRMVSLNAAHITEGFEAQVDKLYKKVLELDNIFVGEIRDNYNTIQAEKGVVLNAKDVLSIAWLEFNASNPLRFSEEREKPSSSFVVYGERPKEVASANPSPPEVINPDDASDNSASDVFDTGA